MLMCDINTRKYISLFIWYIFEIIIIFNDVEM